MSKTNDDNFIDTSPELFIYKEVKIRAEVEQTFSGDTTSTITMLFAKGEIIGKARSVVLRG